ncbi:Der1 [Kluyveromyces lactis]|nr:Der1 [Kluyveromyces lactis]
MDLIRDVPIITRCWGIGILMLNLALWCNVLTVYDVAYSWDAVYYRKQYLRLIYGLFYIKLSPDLIGNAVVALSSLQLIEQTTADKRKLALKILCLYLSVVFFIIYSDLPLSIGQALGINMWYYVSKKSNNAALFVFNVAVNVVWIPISSIALIYLLTPLELRQALALIIPGHLLYFIDEAMSKTYGFNI